MAHDNTDRKTRHLGLPNANDTDPNIPIRVTGPLDDALPWVIEFRVVGTARTIQVQVHEAMLIGRSDPHRGIYPHVDLDPHGAQSSGVSRQHAAILVKNNRIYVKDLGSVNGTRLNSYSLVPQHEYRLRHDDQLEIGQIKLQVRFLVVPTTDISPAEGDTTQTQIPVIGQGQHVLVVEDDHDVANVFSVALKHAGFRVTSADTATAALGFVSEKLPDVIVLDLMLPDMNGADLAQYLRTHFPNQHIPLIIVSGAPEGFHASQARGAGADLLLGKPISVNEFVQAVGQVLGDPKKSLSS
jgi:two-component system phosphate regulon response regulator PhoB